MSNVKISLRVVAGMGMSSTIWDSAVRGFGIRRQRRDAIYILKYRFQGRQRFYTIGKHGAPWTPDTARSEALRLLGSIVSNERPCDPSAERHALKAQITFEEFAKRYLSDYAEPHKKPRTVAEDQRNLKLHIVPLLGHLRVREITRADAARLHATRRKFPANANRCLATLSHMLTVAETWGLRPEDTNPCRKISRYPELPRERSLTPDELHRLGTALSSVETEADIQEDWRAIACYKLLLFTGARLGEILTLRWDWIDWTRNLARLPDSKTGRKNLLLPAPAMNVLLSLPMRATSGYVLPGMRVETHFVSIQKPWQRIRKLAGLEDVRLHDLRHAFASVAVCGSDSLYTVGAILGHRQAATTQRYAHLSLDPIRVAADRTASSIAGFLQPRRTA